MILDADQLLTLQVFFPFLARKYSDFLSRNGRLVHYTSAEAAVEIVKNKEVWMRNCNAVNDFREIEHGFDCLNAAYKGPHGQKLKDILNRIHEGFSDELERRFNEWLPHFRTDTYITAVSEHLESEDTLGRLSMWRAYGGATGVAVVLNNKAFLSTSNALKAYSSPVAYLSEGDFSDEFKALTDNVEKNTDYISNLSREELVSTVFSVFRFSILCTKHPGFHEEREWRIIYSPKFEKSDKLVEEIQVIKGSPQRIFKIPLQDFPDEGFVGASIPELVERVIIGPSQYPWTIKDAVVSLLEQAGIPDAASKVWISDIPLRQ